MVLLSIYDGGYKASISVGVNCIYDLEKIDSNNYDYTKDKWLGKFFKNLILLYNEFIKNNKWYSHKKDALKYIFSLDEDLDYIYICEDGNIEVVKRGDTNV